MLRVYGKSHVAHTYANPIVVSVSSATGRAYTMLRQTEWCYSEFRSIDLDSNVETLSMCLEL